MSQETQNSNAQPERHPSFRNHNSERWSDAWDFGLSREKMFSIPTNFTVWVLDEKGEKHRHYTNDDTLFCVREGRTHSYVRNEQAAAACGYKFSLRTQQWMKETDTEFYGRETQLPYHSTRARADYTMPGDDWKVGFEVEKEDHAYEHDGSVWKLFQQTGWVREHDGSLGDGGYELISPILPMLDRSRLKKALAPVKKYIDAKYSERCGGHINMSCKGKDSDEILENLKNGMGLIYAIYQNRMFNRFCHVKKYEHYVQYPDKYTAFYKKSSRIVEIRLFPAVKSVSNLLWRVDLLRWIISVDTDSFAKKIAKLQNKNTFLYQHMRKIYDEGKIRDICQRAIKHHQKWVAPLSSKDAEKLKALGFVVNPALISDAIPATENGEPTPQPAGRRQGRPSARRRQPATRNADGAILSPLSIDEVALRLEQQAAEEAEAARQAEERERQRRSNDSNDSEPEYPF